MQMADDNLSNAARQRRALLQGAGLGLAALGLGLTRPAVAQGTTSSETDVLDVVILGAGLAGLTAARDLRLAGCESFLVLEARDRVGGRTLNHDLGNGYISEAGGQWIGPGQTAVADLARELDIETFVTYYEGKITFMSGDGKVSLDLDGTFGPEGPVHEKLNALAKTVPSGAPWKAPNAAELDKLSLGDWLNQQDLTEQDKVVWDTASILSGGAAPAKMGLLHFLSMINSANSQYAQLDNMKDSAQETRFVGGSQILSIRMAEALGDKVRLSSPVSKISGWDQPVVTIETAQGVLRARQVIVAMMPAVANQIVFEPALPAKRRELMNDWPAYSPARKTAHVYPKPFWREKGFNGQIIQVGGPLMWSWDNSPPDGSIGVINAFVRQTDLPEDPQRAGEILSGIYAEVFGNEALRPTQYHDHDWGKADPWTISCVSAMPPGLWTRVGEALLPPCGKLIWSGTETADIWAGYMDGAVRSGHRAALQVLQALRQDACAGERAV
jgi:monoamine oxidase